MSVDLRTRVDSEQHPVEADRLFRDTLPPLLDAHQGYIAPGARELPLADFCIETEGEPWTLSWQRDRVQIQSGRHGKARGSSPPSSSPTSSSTRAPRSRS